MSVLIIDDSSFIRSVIANVVTGLGMQVAGLASNGEEGLEMMERLRPKYLTLDMMLPDMTGLDVLKVVKAHYPEIKVIMITTIAKPSIIAEAKELDVDKYLIKPVVDEDLVSAFRELEGV